MAEFVSTRSLTGETVDYQEAVLRGQAPDGGLYVPAADTRLNANEVSDLAGRPYQEVFDVVRASLIDGDIPPEEQVRITAQAYAAGKFPEAKDGNLVPVEQIGDNLYIQNLSLGPTAAFKDMALQPLAREMEYGLSETDRELIILGVSSGDTASSAEAAFKGLSRVLLFMMTPAEGMSDFQKAQIAEFSGGNVHNISIRGSFDGANALIDRIKKHPEFHDVSAINSINFGRIAAQIPYYFSGALQADNGEVDFVVPTGNFGNIYAGHRARQLGAPIRNLVAANNENDASHRAIQDGVYFRCDPQVTSSPSMDICQPRNYERLVYELLEGDGQAVRRYMRQFAETGKVALTAFGLKPSAIKEMGFDSYSSTHAERLDTIRWVYSSSGTVIDPHTADAVTAARHMDREVPTICLATALPVKFEATVREALGFVPERPERFKDVGKNGHEDGFVPMDCDSDQLMTYMREQVAASA